MRPEVPLLLFLLLAPAVPVAAEPGAAELEWRKAETAHLRVYSSTRDGKTREVAEGLELLRGALEVALPRPASATEGRTTVFLFRSERDYRPYREAFAPEAEAVRGHLVAHPLGRLVAIDAYPREGAWSQPVAFHEMTHAYVEDRLPGAPPWLREGLAEYFSTFQRIGERAQIGVVHPGHLRHLRSSRFLPWPRLLQVDATPHDEHQAEFYAQSWLLVHWLRHRAEAGADRFAAYLASLTEGRNPQIAFRDAFGIDPTGLETRLRAYLATPTFPRSEIEVSRLDPVAAVEIRPAPASEVLYRLGILLAFGGRGEDLAAEHFRAALGAGEPDARAGEAFLLEDRNPVAAESAYREAVARGADDPLTFHLYGRWLVRRLQGEVPGPAPPLDETREILRKAVELAPEDPRPRALLGMTWLFAEEDPSPGIAHLRAAREGLPGRPAILFNLAMLHVRAGEIAPARSIVEGDLRAVDPELAARARAEVERKELETAVNAALDRREPDAARDLVLEARNAADPIRAEELDEWLEEIDAQAARQRDTALYNRAIDFANFGEWDEARALLEQLLETGTTPEVLAAARKLLDEAE